jgi:hypothetical protein
MEGMLNRRIILLGWITLAIVGATSAIVDGPAAGAPTAVLQASSYGPTTTAAPTTTTTVAPTTTDPATTTTAPPAPTTVAPAPTTTAAPAAPRTTTTRAPRAPKPAAARPAPAPAPAPAAAPTAPSATSDYAMSLLRQVVPSSWLNVVPVHFEIIAGKTSWSSFGGLIEVGDWQLTSSVGRARFTLAHEWGHQLAWGYGTDEFNGAAPAGFPYNGRIPEEQWADCVAQALTGTSYPSGGLGACPGDALAFARQFLNAGPPGPPLR